MDNIEVFENNVANVLDKYVLELDAKQLQALPMLAFGVRIDKVAHFCEVPRTTITGWKSQNRAFNSALSELSQEISKYHAQKLNSLLLLSWDKIEAILLQDYQSLDDFERKEVARTARFIIDKAITKQSTMTVVHEEQEREPNITEGSAEMIARHIKRLESDGEVETEYSIVDLEDYLALHSETDYGKLNYDKIEKKFQCHICGDWFSDLRGHIKGRHGVSVPQYLDVFRLDDLPHVTTD